MCTSLKKWGICTALKKKKAGEYVKRKVGKCVHIKKKSGKMCIS